MGKIKIAVLGLGKSISEFVHAEYDWSVGVNDIWKFHHSGSVVVLDYPKAFTPDRLSVINNCKPVTFYSQMVVWDTRPDFKKIDILSGYPDNGLNLDTGIYKSFCSPFVAVQIAYKYHYAQEIHLFGVDLVDHPNLNGDLCRRIHSHFQWLKAALTSKQCDLIVHGSGILTTLL